MSRCCEASPSFYQSKLTRYHFRLPSSDLALQLKRASAIRLPPLLLARIQPSVKSHFNKILTLLTSSLTLTWASLVKGILDSIDWTIVKLIKFVLQLAWARGRVWPDDILIWKAANEIALSLIVRCSAYWQAEGGQPHWLTVGGNKEYFTFSMKINRCNGGEKLVRAWATFLGRRIGSTTQHEEPNKGVTNIIMEY